MYKRQGEWGDQLDRTMESFNSKHDDIELDITMQSGDYSDFLGTAAATNDWPDIYILTPWTQDVYKRQPVFPEAP